MRMLLLLALLLVGCGREESVAEMSSSQFDAKVQSWRSALSAPLVQSDPDVVARCERDLKRIGVKVPTFRWSRDMGKITLYALDDKVSFDGPLFIYVYVAADKRFEGRYACPCDRGA